MEARNRVSRPSRPLSTYEITLQIQQGISEKEASLLKQLHEASMDKQLNISNDETLLPVSTADAESHVNNGLSNKADDNSGSTHSDKVLKTAVTPLVTEDKNERIENTTEALSCDTSPETNEDNCNLSPENTTMVLEPDGLKVSDVEVEVAEESTAIDIAEDKASTKVTPASEIHHAHQETSARQPADVPIVDVVPAPETVITSDNTEKRSVVFDSHYSTLADKIVVTAIDGAMVSISEEKRSAEVKQEVHEPLSTVNIAEDVPLTKINISQTGSKEVLQLDTSEVPMDANTTESISENSNDNKVKMDQLDNASAVSIAKSTENLPSPPQSSEELPEPPANFTRESINDLPCEFPPPAFDLPEPGDLPAPPPLKDQTKESEIDALPPPPPDNLPAPLLDDDLPSPPDITPIEPALPLPPSLLNLANVHDLPPPTYEEDLPLPPEEVKVETTQEQVEEMGLPSPPAIVVNYTEDFQKEESNLNNAHVEPKVNVDPDEVNPKQSDQEIKTITVTKSPEDPLPDKTPSDNADAETSKQLNDQDAQHTTEPTSTPKGDAVPTGEAQGKPENNIEQSAIEVPTRGQEQANADKKIKHTKGCCTIL